MMEAKQIVADAIGESAFKAATEVVVFGSRSAGAHRGDSDWDFLCIGDGTTVRGPVVDLVWIGRDAVKSERWLGSELANHVARYGVWLKGTPEWRRSVYRSRAAIEHKRVVLERDITIAHSVWNALSPHYKIQRGRRVLANMRRLECLTRGLPVPPTALLGQLIPDSVEDLAAKSGFPEIRVRQLHEILASVSPE